MDFTSREARVKSAPLVCSAALSGFALVFIFLALILLNGYAQNLVADYRSNTWLVLLGVLVGIGALLWLARGRVTVARDGFEFAGFVFVTLGVWLYLVAPSLPTWLPPTHSSDAVRHYLQMMFSYPHGTLVSWYPAGGAFVAATFAHWSFADPLRVLHPTAALFVALSAGAVYGLACDALPKTRAAKMIALLAPAALFAPWAYFAGIIMDEQYFFAQAFAHYFVIAALWFAARYAASPHWIFAALAGVAVLGVVVAYPILVPLPLALCALVLLARIRTRRALFALAILILAMALLGGALERGGILQFRTATISTSSEVGEGGVANPSLENLGGAIFVALALMGAPLAWRAHAIGKTLVAFLAAWLLQLGAFAALQLFIPISAYRVDKSFYILAYPLALFAAYPLARLLERVAPRIERAPRVAMLAACALIVVGVLGLRPPRAYAPLTESEIAVARWAKENLDTYQINDVERDTTRAYWLAFGLWRETLPNEWFQWMPAGAKLGPATFDAWRTDPGWAPYLFVRDVGAVRDASLRGVFQAGASAILQKDLPAQARAQPSLRDEWTFRATLKLLGYDLARTTFAPGETISLTTHSETIYPPRDTVRWRIELVNRAGAVMSQAEADPFANKYPLQRWSPGIVARDAWSLPMPAQATPGAYDVRLGLFRRTDGDLTSVFRMSPSGAITQHLAHAPLARIKVPLVPPSADELRAATPVNARVGEAFELTRYAVTVDRDSRAATVVLYWQSVAPVAKSYTVFVHLLDASGNLIAQSDALPAHNAYPTDIWDAREIVTDVHTLSVPANARAPLSLIVGMYDAQTGQRLPSGNRDHVILDF